MTLQFKILDGLPTSGPLPNQFSASGQGTHSEGFVVEFNSGKESWVGNFQRGLTYFDTVINHPDNKNIIVIAGGQAYIVDPASRQLINKLGGAIQDVLFIDEKSLLVLNNNFNLSAYNEAGELWKTRRLTIDGIKNLKYDKNIIQGEGLALNDEWFPFQIDVKNGKVLDEKKLREYLPLD